MKKAPHQLDLFQQAAGSPLINSAAVFCYPLARRRGLVVQVSNDLMSRKTQQARERFWQKIISGLTSELRGHGICPALVETQLMAFHRAVGAEVAGRQSQPVSPNGAA